MEMPEETKQTLQELERKVKEINYMCIEQAKRQSKPYVDMIMDIRAMYPAPIMITQEMLNSMGVTNPRLAEMMKETK